MVIDKQLMFSEAQAVTGSAASQNVINQGAAGDAYDHPLFLVAQVKQAAAAAGAATVNFVLQTDGNEGFTTPRTVYDSGPIPVAELTAKAEPVKVRLPAGLNQFLRGYFVVTTGPLTAGSFNLFLAHDVKVGKQ
jgi:hypothetical protein